MGIFKENFDKKEKEIRDSIQLPTDLSKQQNSTIDLMNQSLIQEKEHDNVLTVLGLEHFHSEQLKGEYVSRYKVSSRNLDARASDRQIRKRAEKKASKAMKLQKML